MKNIHNYIMLFIVAFAVASCADDEIIENKDLGKSGDEVQFGLSLDNDSRTVYGEEAGNAFPIYWVNGDKVQIFSPQALEGRRNAEYKVTVSGETQDYADNLEKTGAFGVQWGNGREGENGEVGLHDFYSLYPSGNYTLSTDGKKAENITINSMQNIVVNGGVVKSDMEDCLMYAKTTGVTKGTVVNLQYNPITTVLMVKLKVAANQTGTDPDKFTIQYIKLEADTDIAGTFSLNISDGSFASFAENKVKNIQADIVNNATGGYHSISNGEYLEIPLFLAPTFTVNEDETVKGPNVKNWKISILANGNIYTKTLNIDKTLTPGQIHKITLPELSPAAAEWDVAKWMTYIPRNVYLSEVSIPGSWNSINDDFQTIDTDDVTTIENQYKEGVRAFHLDTRYNATRTGSSWTGGYTYTITDLAIANGDDSWDANNSGNVNVEGKVMNNSTTFYTALSTITSQVKDDEYMVVIVTFAQNSATKDNEIWEQAVSDVCALLKDKVIMATEINSNTVVGDVLGQVIVIVNTETIPTIEGSRCFFANVPLKLSKGMFGEKVYGKNPLYYGKDQSDIILYSSQCQVEYKTKTLYTGQGDDNSSRGYLPTPTERQQQLNDILSWSKNNYKSTTDYTHNNWIYLGIGGYQGAYGSITGNDVSAVSGSYSTIAKTYNGWISSKVNEMGTIPEGQTVEVNYYPVGIVLMNYVKDYASTVKDVLLLNNRYRLQYDSSKPVDYNGTTTKTVKSAASGYSMGVKDEGKSAF